MADNTPLLEASSLYVSLGGLPILRDVSLQVRTGEAVAILGGNGSGKTTTLRAILGLIPFQQGSVKMFGTELAQFHAWDRVGYVPQHSSLNVSNATVREIVSSGRLSHHRIFQWLNREDRIHIDHALELVGLADRARWPFQDLSGGQKQRALIARALSSRPELLIMDEPLAGVDLHSQAGLAQLLGELRSDGLGLAVVLHEQGPMASVLDRWVTLCDGRIVESESHGATDCAPDQPEQSRLGLLDPVAGVRR
ncbi:MAG: metal ABC transporter ATP-binding protein [Propionibacteriaceae bacterium]|nr:metal ABC transporter ATP-binding protein [Propionibacteriaceae bacterium]